MSAPAAVSVKWSVSVKNGHLLTKRNMPRIRAISREIDRCHVGPGALPNYRCEYRLIHNPKKGFAFVEVYYGCGMTGFQSTIRKAVVAASRFADVVVDETETIPRPASSFYKRDFEACWGVPPALFGRESV